MTRRTEYVLALEMLAKENGVGHLTTGLERTPLRRWTPEQVDAYKRQRLAEVLGRLDGNEELP
jgi:hypothetical protein